MQKMLITGATGNIGLEVIHYLQALNPENRIIAAVRNAEKAKKKFPQAAKLDFRLFDFEDPETYATAFNQVDLLFLLRPPHLADVERYFRPLLVSAKENGVEQVVFLSVQGAEKSKVIPHNKIERLIQELGFDYIFVRPSYFMQNLSTTLLPEIVNHKSITLPSAQAKFNWIDVKNIGEATARLILDFEKYQNQSYEITGSENKDFAEVTTLMTKAIGEKISYKSVNPINFYFKKRKEGLASGFAVVMTMLHFLPRLQSEPEISKNYQQLTGKHPTTLAEFMEREKETFTAS